MRILLTIAFIALSGAVSAQSIVTSSGGRSIVVSGSAPKIAEPVAETPKPDVRFFSPVEESTTYIVAFTASWCGPCRNWKTSELPKLKGIEVRSIDIDDEPQWGVSKPPEFWIADRKTRRVLKKFKGYTSAVTLLQYENPPLPELPSQKSDAPRYRIYDGNPASVLQNRQSLIDHLMTDGVHAGKHTREQLEQLGDQQLDDLHTHDHRINGQVKQLSGPVPGRYAVWQGRTYDMETFNPCGSSRCSMCANLNAAKQRYQAAKAAAYQPTSFVPDAQQPTPDEILDELVVVLGLKADSVLCDFGCGSAGVLIRAVQKTGCSGIGVELDPVKSEEARRAVEAAGMSSRVEIITGDVLDFQPELHGVTHAYCYLYPDLLEKLEPTLRRVPCVVSGFHEIPGMDGQVRLGDFYRREVK